MGPHNTHILEFWYGGGGGGDDIIGRCHRPWPKAVMYNSRQRQFFEKSVYDHMNETDEARDRGRCILEGKENAGQ